MSCEKTISDESEFIELLFGCKNNELKYQSKFYSKYYYIVYNTCKKYIKTPSDIEDMTHDIFIKLIDKINSFNGESPGQFVNWLKTITKNCVIDTIRKNKTYINFNDDILIDINTVDLGPTDILDEEMVIEIKKLIAKLSPKYRNVFELYYINYYTHQEIADELNINIGTSKSNLFKGKKRIAEMLKGYNNNFN